MLLSQTSRRAGTLQRIFIRCTEVEPIHDWQPETLLMKMVRTLYLTDTLERFRSLKKLADGALAQVTEGEFFAVLDRESNSLAILVKHMAGNMRSRWRDFLTSDGEKPDRHRDSEFEVDPSTTSRQRLLQFWESGWADLFHAIEALEPTDLGRTVLIRAEPHRAIEAIQRQLAHYGYHVGQIVQLAKHWRGPSWKTLSIARGQSDEFNRQRVEPDGDGDGDRQT